MHVKEFNITELGQDNMTINFSVAFEKPYMLGLLGARNDKLYVHLKYYLLTDYCFFKPEFAYLNAMFRGNVSETRLFPHACMNDRAAMEQLRFEPELIEAEPALLTIPVTTFREDMQASTIIPLLFDMNNEMMKFWREYYHTVYEYIVGFICLQLFLLTLRGVGRFSLWISIEYLQLASFLPLFNFRMMPYLYDVVKPVLVTHLIFEENVVIDYLSELDD